MRWGVFKQKLFCLRIIPCAVGLQLVWDKYSSQVRYGFVNIKGLLCWQPAAQLMVHAVCWSELLEISDQLSGMHTLVIRGLSFWHPSCTFSYYKITALIIFQTLCKPLVYINCLSQSIVSDIIRIAHLDFDLYGAKSAKLAVHWNCRAVSLTGSKCKYMCCKTLQSSTCTCIMLTSLIPKPWIVCVTKKCQENGICWLPTTPSSYFPLGSLPILHSYNISAEVNLWLCSTFRMQTLVIQGLSFWQHPSCTFLSWVSRSSIIYVLQH